VVERPHEVIGFHTLGFWKFLVEYCLIGDRMRPLGGKKGGENDVKSQHFQGCSPLLCQLKTDGLAPVSKY
jgi:hypothetical protein